MLLLIIIVAFSLSFALQIATRGLDFYSFNNDNQKQARAAAAAGQWRWPSDMHLFGGMKTAMKDVTVLLLAVMQRLLRDFKTDHPLVTLCAHCHALSGVFIYLILVQFTQPPVAILMSLLFLTSLWGWQIVLMGQHVLIATALFLSNILLILKISHIPDFGLQTSCLILVGAIYCAMMYSSASARKYTILFCGVFTYGKMISLGQNSAQEFLADMSSRLSNIYFITLAGAIGLALLPLFFRRSMLRILFFLSQRSSFFSQKLFSQQKTRSLTLDHYLNDSSLKGKWDRFRNDLIKLIGIPVFLYTAVGLHWFLSFAAGLILFWMFLNFPNFKANIKIYLEYYHLGTYHGHFRLYESYFKKRGIFLKPNMNGAGWPWVWRIFLEFAPVHSIVCVLVILGAVAKLFIIGDLSYGFTLGSILFLGISPVLWGEFTGGPQLSRSYFPGLVGIVFLTGFEANYLNLDSKFIWTGGLVALAISSVWNWHHFKNDVFPSRMATSFVMKELRRLGAKKFYTYFPGGINETLMDAVSPMNMGDIEVHHIRSISEVSDGLIVVPPTSCDTFNTESTVYGVTGEDFKHDPTLNSLFESGKIEDATLVKLKTFGTSHLWVHESEVTSYRYLILKDFVPENLVRAYARILDAKKIHI